MKSIWIFRLAVIFCLLMVWGLVSCGSDAFYQASEAATQHAQDPGSMPSGGMQTSAALYGFPIVMSPTVMPTSTPDPHWTPTMSFLDFSGTQVAQQHAWDVTQQANQLAIEQARLAAEARAQREAEEAKRAQETAIAYGQQQTAEARVWFAQQTAHAEATYMMSTVQAQATTTSFWVTADAVTAVWNGQNTAVAAQATAAIQPTHAVWTQNAVYAAETITAGEAEKVQLAVRRQTMKNVFDAYLPWAIVVGAVLVLAYGFGEFIKTRTHARDEHGAVPLIERKTKAGSVYVKPEFLETAIVKVTNDGDVIRYSAIDAREQSDITRRAQAVEAIRAMPTPYAQTGAKIMSSEFGRGGARVGINPNAPRGPVVDEAERNFLEEAGNA